MARLMILPLTRFYHETKKMPQRYASIPESITVTVTVRFGSSFQRRRGLCAAAASPPSGYSKLQTGDGCTETEWRAWSIGRQACSQPAPASPWSMVSLRSLLSEP